MLKNTGFLYSSVENIVFHVFIKRVFHIRVWKTRFSAFLGGIQCFSTSPFGKQGFPHLIHNFHAKKN